MTEQLISFETAKLAKEKGFDNGSDTFYAKNTVFKSWDLYVIDDIGGRHYNSKNNSQYEAPTQSLLQKWLRDEHKLHILIHPDKMTEYNNGELFFNCSVKLNARDYEYALILRHKSKIAEYNTYEEALEEGLKQSLKLIK